MAEKVERLTYKIQFDAESGTSTIRGLDGTIKATMVSTQKLRQEYGNFATQIKATNAEVNNLSRGKDGNGGLNGMSAASGSATAAALELGRVVSDAPYGIRGMANNVSQLASNLAMASIATNAATGKVVGFNGAIKGMWTALKGPLGVLLAIQVVVSAIDYFAGSTKKAKEEVDGLNESIIKQVEQFNLLKQVIDGMVDIVNPLSDFTSEEGLIVLRDTFKELDKKLTDLEKRGEATPSMVESLVDSYGKLLKTRKDIAIEEQNIIDNDGKWTKAQIEFGQSRLMNLQLYRISLEKLFDVAKDGSKKSIKEFKQSLLDLSSELASFREKEIQNADISEEERLRLEYEASRKAVENKRLEYKDKEDASLEAKLKEVNDSKATEDEKARLIEDAYQKYNEAQIQANEDLRSVMLQADIAYYAELSALRKKDTEAAKEESKDLIAALTENNFDYQEFNETQKINAATNDLNRIRDELEGSQRLTDLKVSGLEKELLAEEGNVVEQQKIRNKIAKLNQDQTLYEEELDRKSATAKIGIAMQIADTIAAIAGEGSGIAKGVAVAQTIWNTKQAFMAALGSAPYGPWNIAQATAVGVMGIKNVSDILATKAPNEKSADVSAKNAAMSGGGGGSAFNPNFNIVGASGSNQLAETVAGQIGEPTRAYVVYDDIATAGEIEANAIEASGI